MGNKLSKTLNKNWKLLLIIWLLSLIILAGMGMVCQVSAQETSSKVNENFEELALTDVIKIMQQRYDLKVAFEKAVIEGIKINTSITNATMKTAWDNILKDTELEFIMLGDKRIVIRKKQINNNIKEEKSFETKSMQHIFSGKVRDSKTGETIPYATVSIANSNKGAIANQDGFFSFTASTLPSDSLKISHLGYESYNLALSNNYDEFLEIQLNSTSSYLQEVEVRNTLPDMIETNAESGYSVINPEKVAKLPQIGERDIFRSLQLLPGISIANENASGLRVRGGLPDQNLVMFDGFTIYHLDHLYGFFSSINFNAVKDIRIYKGGFDARYGGRISSIIDITGKSGNKYEPSIDLGLNLLSADVKAEVPITNNLTALVAFRRSYTDVYQTGLFETIYDFAEAEIPEFIEPSNNININGEDDNFYYYDLHAKLNWNASEKDVLSFSFYSGKDDYDKSQSFQLENTTSERTETLEEDFTIGNTGMGFKWGRYWNRQLYSSASVGYSKYEKSYLYNIQSTLTENNLTTSGSWAVGRFNELDELTARIDFEYYPNEKNQLDFGVYLVDNNISYEDEIINIRKSFINGDEGTQMGVYLQNTFQPVEKIKFTTGVRSTYYSATNQMYLEPRVSASWKMGENLVWNAATGKYYQFISQAESDLSFGFDQDFWVLSGNQGTSLLSAWHYQTGLLYQRNGWSAELSVYHRDITGLTRGGYQNLMGASDLYSQWEFNGLLSGGEGKISGIDIYVGRQWQNYAISLSYSLAQVKHQFDEINNGVAFYADHDQRHELKMIQFLKKGRFNFSMDWVYGSGMPYSQPTDALINGSSIWLLYREKNNRRLPIYHRMDVAASYDFQIGKTLGNVGISVFNLYDRHNVGDRSFIFDRQNIFKRNGAPQQIVRILSYDHFLLQQSLSIFMNIKI
ncbi:MAG: TonB-dependent receptor [Bacteroidota bacterium]